MRNRTPEVVCDPGPCKADEHGYVRRNVARIGTPTCKSVEFEVTAEARTIAFEL